jgi:hypothetical protein
VVGVTSGALVAGAVVGRAGGVVGVVHDAIIAGVDGVSIGVNVFH